MEVPPDIIYDIINIDLLLEDEVCVPPVSDRRDHMGGPVAALKLIPGLSIAVRILEKDK